jgi:hypothetical protein
MKGISAFIAMAIATDIIEVILRWGALRTQKFSIHIRSRCLRYQTRKPRWTRGGTNKGGEETGQCADVPITQLCVGVSAKLSQWYERVVERKSAGAARMRVKRRGIGGNQPDAGEGGVPPCRGKRTHRGSRTVFRGFLAKSA